MIRKLLAVSALTLAMYGTAAADDGIARGRLLLKASGCNDCHTDGYMAREGNVPEREWLTGSPVGFQGPWGTTYAANLRLRAAQLTEAQWLAVARARRQPPMPWFNLAALPDDDLRAMYRYLRSAGPAGSPAPAWVPPGGTVTTPFVVFVPQDPPAAPTADVAMTR
jgi:mono/diheme cytochrome c family protein